MNKWIVLLMTTTALASTCYEINCISHGDQNYEHAYISQRQWDLYHKAESLTKKSRELLYFCRNHIRGASLLPALTLLREGADANAFYLGTQTATYGMKTIITQYYAEDTCLSNAVRSRDAQLVQLLVDHGASVMNVASVDHCSPLQQAARLGDKEICEILIKAGSDVNYQLRLEGDWGEVSLGESPLHLAASHGHAAVCKVLIDHGANVNAIYGYGYYVGEPRTCDITALQLARQSGHQDVEQILLAAGAIEDASLPHPFALQRFE